MAADEHLQGGQFFHGTNAAFNEGDQIVPGHDARHGNENDRVCVANNAWVASGYGHRTYEVTPHAPPRKRSKAGEFHTTGATVVRELSTPEITQASNQWYAQVQKNARRR